MSLRDSTVAIIDDEQDAITYLTMLLDEIPGYKVLFSEQNPIQALRKIKESKPDIVTIDIKMPNLSGLALAELIVELNIQVIFISAFDISAREAFGVNAIDFIYKPASKQRLTKALSKAKNAHQAFAKIEELNRSNSQNEFLIIYLGNNSVNKIPVNSIKFVQGGSDYAQILTVENKKYLDPRTLQELEITLASHNIVRVHKSFIVNMNMAEKITPNHIILNTGEEFPVGRTYKTMLLARFANIN